MAITYTNHANVRMQQRALRDSDINMIINTGTALDDDSIILLNRDVDKAISNRKREIERLEKLRSVRVVLGENRTVITAYRSDRKNEKCLMRGSRHHRPRVNYK